MIHQDRPVAKQPIEARWHRDQVTADTVIKPLRVIERMRKVAVADTAESTDVRHVRAPDG
jgi:hypothetical protein